MSHDKYDDYCTALEKLVEAAFIEGCRFGNLPGMTLQEMWQRSNTIHTLRLLRQEQPDPGNRVALLEAAIVEMGNVLDRLLERTKPTLGGSVDLTANKAPDV